MISKTAIVLKLFTIVLFRSTEPAYNTNGTPQSNQNTNSNNNTSESGSKVTPICRAVRVVTQE
jgi:hypothetical protein